METWKNNNMLMNEQKYKKLIPKYYHGSAYDSWNEDLSFWKCFYMTNSFEYAMTYAHKENRDFGYMYICRINKELNIFNPRSSRDFHALVKYLAGDPNDKDTVDFVSKMIDTDWLALLGKKDRDSLLDALKSLGYDGFFNYEGDYTVGLKPAIGVFDFNNIEIVKVLNDSDIKNIIESDHVMKSHRNEQKHAYLRGEVDKNSLWRKISLLESNDFIVRADHDELRKKLNQYFRKKETENK